MLTSFNYRHCVVRQVHEDLLTFRLPCPQKKLAKLCAYWVQSERGNFRDNEVDRKLLEGFRFVSGKKRDWESEFMEEVSFFYST